MIHIIEKDVLCRIGTDEFHSLIEVMLQNDLGIGIKFYSDTKDKGCDASFEGEARFPPHKDEWSGKWVFQTKYRNFLRRGENEVRKDLKNSLKNELEKILNKYGDSCDNYIYISNIDLTFSDIKEMENIAHSFPIKNFEVIHFKHIRNFLVKHPELKSNFPKLLDYSDLLTLSEEKNSITDLFIQFKNDIETFYVSHLLPLYDIPLSSFLGNIPFYKSQQEKLIKLGIIVLNPNNKENNQIPVSLKMRMNYTFLFVILNKYYIGVYNGQEHRMNIEIETIQKQKTFDSIEEVEEMLKEMINYSKKRFNINLNENMIDLSEYKNIWEEI